MPIFYLTGPLLIALGSIQLVMGARLTRPPCVGPTATQREELLAAHDQERTAINATLAIMDQRIALLEQAIKELRPRLVPTTPDDPGITTRPLPLGTEP